MQKLHPKYETSLQFSNISILNASLISTVVVKIAWYKKHSSDFFDIW